MDLQINRMTEDRANVQKCILLIVCLEHLAGINVCTRSPLIYSFSVKIENSWSTEFIFLIAIDYVRCGVFLIYKYIF